MNHANPEVVASANSAPVLTPDALPAITPPTLEAAFGQLGDLVRRRGDVLDRLPLLRRSIDMGAVGLAGASVTGVYAGMVTSGTMRSIEDLAYAIKSPVFDLACGGLLLTTACASRAFRPLARRYLSRKPQPQLELQQQIADDYFGGEPVELYRTRLPGKGKQRELQLVWQPSETDTERDTGTLAAQLRNLAAGMTAARAQRVAMPQDVFADYAAELPEDSLEHTTANEWLQDYKRTKTVDKVAGNREWALMDTKTLDALIECVQESKHEEPLHSIMTTLARVRPDHPLLARYHIGVKSKPAEREAFMAAASRAVDRHLHDTDRVPVAVDPELPGLRESKKAYLIGRSKLPDGQDPFIRWQQIGRFGYGQKSDLLGFFRTTDEALEWLPQRFADMPPHKVVEQCELAALLCMYDRINPAAPIEGKIQSAGEDRRQTASGVATCRALGARAAEHTLKPPRRQAADAQEQTGISTKPNRFERGKHAAMRLAGALGIGAVLGMSIISVRSYEYNEARSAATAALGEPEMGSAAWNNYAAEQLDNPLYNTLGEIVDVRSNYAKLVYRGWDEVVSVIQGKYTAKELEGIVSGSAGQAYNEAQTNVGNILSGDQNKVDWRLEPKGMSSEGLWLQMVYDRLSVQNSYWLGDYGMLPAPQTKYTRGMDYGQAIAAEFDRMTPLSGAASVASAPQVIKVSRSVALSADNYNYQYWGQMGILPGGGSVYIVRVPVLKGTSVVAARFDGAENIRSQVLKDGTTVLLVPTNGERIASDLEYWVVPDANAPKPHAIGPLEQDETDPQATIDQTWAGYGVPLSDTGMKRINDETARLKAMDYNLAPLPDMGQKVWTPDSYVDQVLKGNKANCNVANTALAISNPEELNLATGYNNSNSKQQIKDHTEMLSSHEAHAVAVDRSGVVHDGTPGLGIPEDQKDFFNEDNVTSPEDPRQLRTDLLRDGALATAALAAAGIGWWQRRRIARAARGARQGAAAAVLAGMDKTESEIAFLAFAEAAYGEGRPDVRTIWPRVDGPKNSGDDYLKKFQDLLAVDPGVNAVVAKRAKEMPLSPDSRKAIRRAQRIIRLLRAATKN